jgi:hypothetical protein
VSRRPLVPVLVLIALLTPRTSAWAGGRYHAGETVQQEKLYDGQNAAFTLEPQMCSRNIITLTAAKTAIGKDTYATVFESVEVGDRILHSFGKVQRTVTTWAFVPPDNFDVAAGVGHRGLPSYEVTVDCMLTSQGATAWSLYH